MRAHITERFREQASEEEHSGFLRELWLSSWCAGRGRPGFFDVRFCRTRILSRNFARSPARIRAWQVHFAPFRRPRNSFSASRICWCTFLPHYIHEGKSYLTISFGCTGGQHRSVMIAEEVGKRLHQSRIPGEDCASRYAEVGELTICRWPFRTQFPNDISGKRSNDKRSTRSKISPATYA